MDGRGPTVTDLRATDRSVQAIYDSIADTYDHVTRRNDYDRWVALYLGLIERHGAPGRRLLDVGAGTGQAAVRFAQAGYRVTAVDVSPEMLRQARAKPGAGQVRFVVADVRELPDLGRFDVAVTLGEPFIYLRDEQELSAALRGVSALLTPGGLVVVDLGTAGFHQRHPSRVVVEDGGNEFAVVRGASSRRDPHGSDYLIDRFTTDDGITWRRFRQRHEFSYFAPEVVGRLLGEAGLTHLATHGLHLGELIEEADEELHRKSFVVARKPG
ncbi:Methyltransferase domain-containing protein [Micromonospora carbonacea]|uniref:Methyltransferase domain-containing protein n=1 Tax=Micromonospora carbonacea TaxID=47853 RepID=A0A1C4VFF1_9ACTN|nr:Methyltransferase domain-containing protein [Micromonospora carbonacea]